MLTYEFCRKHFNVVQVLPPLPHENGENLKATLIGVVPASQADDDVREAMAHPAATFKGKLPSGKNEGVGKQQKHDGAAKFLIDTFDEVCMSAAESDEENRKLVAEFERKLAREDTSPTPDKRGDDFDDKAEREGVALNGAR
jgi:hypothetical protein